MPVGYSRLNFALRYVANVMRAWYLFHIRFPWVKYDGFVRVMPHTNFAKMNIHLGRNVQFGMYCDVATDVTFGSIMFWLPDLSGYKASTIIRLIYPGKRYGSRSVVGME